MQPIFPRLCAINDDIPRELGPAIKKPEPKKPNPLDDFRFLKHEQPPRKDNTPDWPKLTKGGGKTFHERKAERVNGAAPAREQQKPTHSELVAPAPVAAPPEFRAGDRVRAKNQFYSWYGRGDTGTVIHECSSGPKVRFDASPTVKSERGDRNWWANPEDLELIEPAPPSTGVPEPVSGAWLQWTGGQRPVGALVRVEVKFADGGTHRDFASNYDWAWADAGLYGDITGFRVIA